jgi:hypothetical protein
MRNDSATDAPVTRDFNGAFQRVELGGWDAIVDADVLVQSPAGPGVMGLRTLCH